LKDHIGDAGNLADAVRRVADGGVALDPAVVGLLAGRTRTRDPIDT
jgi:hypothetical protein